MFYFLTDIKKNANMFNNNIRGELFPEYSEECGRYDSISDWAVELLIGCNMVALEDYAYGAKGRVFHIAENTGVLKYKLWQQSIPLDVVQPTKVKKFATGKGNAGIMASKNVQQYLNVPEWERYINNTFRPIDGCRAG